MKPREALGLIVRIMGLIITIYSLWWIVAGIAIALGQRTDAPAPLGAYFIVGLLRLGLGMFFIRGAPPLMRFAYPESETTSATLSEAHSHREDVPNQTTGGDAQ